MSFFWTGHQLRNVFYSFKELEDKQRICNIDHVWPQKPKILLFGPLQKKNFLIWEKTLPSLHIPISAHQHCPSLWEVLGESFSFFPTPPPERLMSGEKHHKLDPVPHGGWHYFVQKEKSALSLSFSWPQLCLVSGFMRPCDRQSCTLPRQLSHWQVPQFRLLGR